MTGPVLLILMPLLVWGIPGYLFSRWLLPQCDPLERVLTSLLAGIVTVAPATYLLVVTAAVPATPLLIAAIAAFEALIAVALLRWLPLNAAHALILSPGVARYSLLAAGVIAAVTSLHTTPISIETIDVWWHCPHLSSLYLMEDGSGPGVVAWDPVWERWVSHLFQHPTEPAFGLGPALNIQRPGSAAYLLQLVAFLSTGGLIAAVFCADFLIVGFALLFLGRSSRSVILNVVLAALFLLGVRALAAYQVNENSIGLALSMGALHLLTRKKDSSTVALAAAAGAVLAHLVGIRPVTLLLLPAALVLMRGTHKLRLALVAATVIFMSPWLVAHGQAFSDPLHHPALEYGHQPQTIFADTPLELSFTFHPLNYPVAEQWVRPPTHPYPMNLRLPLELIQAFGAPFLALVMCGLAGLWVTRRRRRLLGLVLWMAPVPLILGGIVALDYQKMSYLLLALGPLPWLAGVAFTQWELARSGRLFLAGAAVLLLLIGPRLVTDLELPIDNRKHGDFLHDRRDDGDDAERRERLTRPSFGPYLGDDLNLLGGAMGWSLLSHSRLPQAADRDVQNPVVIWSALPPAELNHRFQLSTTKAPQVPPEYMGALDLPGEGVNTGRLLFVIQLPPGSPSRVNLALSRTQQKHRLQISKVAGAKVTAEQRYITVLIVDRSDPKIALPVVELFGRDLPLQSVNLWERSDGGWQSQPRLVANFDWGIRYTRDGFVLSDAAPVRIGDSSGMRSVCEGDYRVFKYCPGAHCVRVLTDAAGNASAMRALSSNKALAWDPALSAEHADACIRQFFAGP